ncbi:hypothetical protein FHS20_002025 [Phyllobacterium endophyticum]|nr:hypothetical protein [Phyllobacterium endophyticum]
MSLISLNKRAKTPTAVAYTPWSDDSGRAAEEDMKFYLYWPPAVIMVLLATGSYAIGMYFS